MAYQHATTGSALQLYINGALWETDDVNSDLIKIIANQQTIDCQQINNHLSNLANLHFLFELWQLQWLQFAE